MKTFLLLSVFGLVSVIVFAQDPEIVDDILPEIKRIGQTGRLNCTVVNKGANIVFWLHDESQETISNDERVVVQSQLIWGGRNKYDIEVRSIVDRVTYTLVIRRLLETDRGHYTCYVAMQNTPLTENRVSKTGLLDVQVAPKVRPGESTAVLEIDELQNSTLVCAASGNPSPNITWTRADGLNLPTGYPQFRGRLLPISSADVGHAGVYRCVADNNIKPPDEHLCEVRVFHAPSARLVQDTVGQAQGRRLNARLDCIVNGYPRPVVRWERIQSGGRVLLTDNDFFVISKQTTDNQNMMSGEQWYTLKVKNVVANDYTAYFCVAQNAKGKTEVKIILFETPDCQGPNCPTLASRAINQNTFSSCMLLFSLCVQLLSRR